MAAVSPFGFISSLSGVPSNSGIVAEPIGAGGKLPPSRPLPVGPTRGIPPSARSTAPVQTQSATHFGSQLPGARSTTPAPQHSAPRLLSHVQAGPQLMGQQATPRQPTPLMSRQATPLGSPPVVPILLQQPQPQPQLSVIPTFKSAPQIQPQPVVQQLQEQVAYGTGVSTPSADLLQQSQVTPPLQEQVDYGTSVSLPPIDYGTNRCIDTPPGTTNARETDSATTVMPVITPQADAESIPAEAIARATPQAPWHPLAEPGATDPQPSESGPIDSQLEDAPTTHAVPHTVAHVCVDGVPVPLYERQHLRTLHMTALRAHAYHMHRLCAMANLRAHPLPMSDELLIEWIMEVRDVHLLNFPTATVAAPHVFFRGVPVPLYEERQLQSLTLDELRAHACHVYNTIEEINEPVPEEDYLLLEWLVDVHDKHLNHHLLDVLQDREDRNALLNDRLDLAEIQSEVLRVDEQLAVMRNEALISAEAKKLEDVPPVSTTDLFRVVNDTLSVHGLTATAAAFKQELDVNSELPSEDAEKPINSPRMADSIALQYLDAARVSEEQRQYIEECSSHIFKQRARIEQLTGHLHDLRNRYNTISLEETELNAKLKQQQKQREESRQHMTMADRREEQLVQDVELNKEEITRMTNAVAMHSRNLDMIMTQTSLIREKIEELSQAEEGSEVGQAARIRRLLLQWDSTQGAKRIAAETFAHVDSNHDGQIEWQNGEISRFCRLIFHYHHVAVPPWSDNIWYELFRLCEPHGPASLDVVAALKFARGCLEAALRSISLD